MLLPGEMRLLVTKPAARPVVLLVQSADDSRDMYAEYFHHHGFLPLCPDDLGEALDLAPTADVIVTGIMLPGANDGYEFIRRLRQDDRTKGSAIIVLTSWGWQTERLRALEAGCDVFLTKPCLPLDLLRHVRRAIQSGRRQSVDPIVHGKPTVTGLKS